MKDRFYFNTIIFVFFLLIIVYLEKWLLIPFILGYFLFLIKIFKERCLYIILIIMMTIIFNYSSTIVNNDYYHKGIVDEMFSTSLTIVEDGKKYYLMNISEVFIKGDTITFSASYKYEIEKGGFDIFYKSTNAVGFGYAKNVELVTRGDDIRSSLTSNLLEEDSAYSQLTLLILYGIKNKNTEDLYLIVTKIGLAHLFVVSGFHISLFFLFINKLISKIINNKKPRLFICFSITFIFLYLIYLPLTGMRAIICLLILRMKKIERIEALSITAILFFIINPWCLLTASMILSFGITFSIYLFKPKFNSLLDDICLPVMCFFIAVPTVDTWNSTFNLFAPFLNIIMTPFITLIYICSLLLLPFHGLWPVFNWLFTLFWIILELFQFIYIPIELETINFEQQILLTTIGIIFISVVKDRIVLLNTFFSLTIIFFII